MQKANISISAALTLSMYFLMTLFFAELASAQLSATLNIRTPAPPQLSTWINDRTVVQLIVINRGSAALPNCRASFFIRNIENQNIIARSNDNSAAVPRFTIPAGVSTTTFFGRDLVSEQAVDYDQRLISTAVTTTQMSHLKVSRFRVQKSMSCAKARAFRPTCHKRGISQAPRSLVCSRWANKPTLKAWQMTSQRRFLI